MFVLSSTAEYAWVIILDAVLMELCTYGCGVNDCAVGGSCCIGIGNMVWNCEPYPVRIIWVGSVVLAASVLTDCRYFRESPNTSD